MYKKIILIFLILSTVIFIFINPILCYANDNNKKILIPAILADIASIITAIIICR